MPKFNPGDRVRLVGEVMDPNEHKLVPVPGVGEFATVNQLVVELPSGGLYDVCVDGGFCDNLGVNENNLEAAGTP